MVTDPITELLTSLERDGKPPLPWVVRWSAQGDDPVKAAWAFSTDVRSMGRLLSRVGWERELRLLQAYNVLPPVPVAGILAIARSSRGAERFRGIVPTPPTLDELLKKFRSARV